MAGRKRVSAQIVNKVAVNNVIPLSIKDMKLSGKAKCAFSCERLTYRNVPLLKDIESGVGLISANRDAVVRELYRLVTLDSDGNCTNTSRSQMDGIVGYFRYLDEHEPDATPFSVESMEACIRHLNSQAMKGINPTTPRGVRGSLSYFLRLMGRTLDAKRLKLVFHPDTPSQRTAFKLDTELKPLSKTIVRGYRAFVNHLKNDTPLMVHPYFDQQLFDERAKQAKWSSQELGANLYAFTSTLLPPVAWRDIGLTDEIKTKILIFNHASRSALFLFYMMTGVNSSVLKKMKRSDVRYTDIGNGRYVFKGVKGRAGHKELDNGIGFSKYTKELIDNWLEVSKTIFSYLNINNINDLPLVPYVTTSLEVSDFFEQIGSTVITNRLLAKLFPFNVNASRLRKTKADTLMNVTQDMYLVSMGMNNTVEVTARSYSNGVESDHQRNIAATMETQAYLARGDEIGEAVEKAKILHSDILSDYDYKARLGRNEIPVTTITPSGVRCLGDESVLKQVARKIKNFAIEIPEDEAKCTNFLGCFDCDNHVLVASESDIWLMMSFLEQVTDMKEIPAKNSVPKETYYAIEAILNRTLQRLENKAPEEYGRAKEKMKTAGAHPLYANLRGLSDVMEIFNVG